MDEELEVEYWQRGYTVDISYDWDGSRLVTHEWISECSICGSAVINEDAHAEWHRKIGG